MRRLGVTSVRWKEPVTVEMTSIHLCSCFVGLVTRLWPERVKNVLCMHLCHEADLLPIPVDED